MINSTQNTTFSYAPAAMLTAPIVFFSTKDNQIQIAETLKKQGKYDAAVAAYRNLLKKDPKNMKLWILLIKTHYFFEKYQEARKDLFSIPAKFQNDSEVLYLKSKYCENADKNIDKAIRLCRQALNNLKRPNKYLEKFIYLQLGALFFSKKEYDTAIECDKKAKAIDPNFNMASFNMGMAYLYMPFDFDHNSWSLAKTAFSSVNPKKYMGEVSNLYYSDYLILIKAQEIERKLASRHFSSKDFSQVKEVLLQNFGNDLPGAINGFWKYFVKYLPNDINYNSPQKTLSEGQGACDEYAVLMADILKDANIDFRIIKYQATNVAHVICAFKQNGLWSYSQPDGVYNVKAKTLAKLMQKVDVMPITNSAEVIKIINSKPITIGTISF